MSFDETGSCNGHAGEYEPPRALIAGADSRGKLTAKQDGFAMAYVECGNASEAYRRVYSAGRMRRTRSRWRPPGCCTTLRLP
jgi:hypothetical protein